jgi:hypothetical protein
MAIFFKDGLARDAFERGDRTFPFKPPALPPAPERDLSQTLAYATALAAHLDAAERQLESGLSNLRDGIEPLPELESNLSFESLPRLEAPIYEGLNRPIDDNPRKPIEVVTLDDHLKGIDKTAFIEQWQQARSDFHDSTLNLWLENSGSLAAISDASASLKHLISPDIIPDAAALQKAVATAFELRLYQELFQQNRISDSVSKIFFEQFITNKYGPKPPAPAVLATSPLSGATQHSRYPLGQARESRYTGNSVAPELRDPPQNPFGRI